jgi:hypothetical protein
MMTKKTNEAFSKGEGMQIVPSFGGKPKITGHQLSNTTVNSCNLIRKDNKP